MQQRLKEMFGATDEDAAKLRITALGADDKKDISVLEARPHACLPSSSYLPLDLRA